MTRVPFRPLTLTVSSLALVGVLTACGGSSDDSALSGSTSPSATATPSPSPSAGAKPISVYLSLPANRAADAKSRVKDLPGVIRTHYNNGSERFTVWMRGDITADQRRAVEHALKKMLNG